mmetsp:Transcript_36708/g.88724  ORF Transcript_36708/g.88724 Transcript_36708/m.88724 type:complete len:614 (-) Transcript_36708:6981-8822(-)
MGNDQSSPAGGAKAATQTAVKPVAETTSGKSAISNDSKEEQPVKTATTAVSKTKTDDAKDPRQEANTTNQSTEKHKAKQPNKPSSPTEKSSVVASSTTRPRAVPSSSSRQPVVAQPPKKPAHKVGKANPARDAFLFVGFLGFIFLISFMMGDVGDPTKSKKFNPDGTERKAAPTVVDLRRAHLWLSGELLQKQKESLPLDKYGEIAPRMDCDVFVAPSTLPNAGWGVLAGTNYKTGQEIVFTHGELSLKGVPSLAYPSTYSILLKPHPILHNVEWKIAGEGGAGQSQTPSLVATRDISPGEEFFLKPDDSIYSTNADDNDDHRFVLPRHYFQRTPTSVNFERADDILMRFRQKYQLWHTAKIEKKRFDDIDKALVVLRQAVGLYDKTTSRLLPIKTTDFLLLYSNKQSSAFQSLKNYTHESLGTWGYCWSDIEMNTIDHHQVLSKDFVRKGDRVAHVPLYIVPWNSDNNNVEKRQTPTCDADSDSDSDDSCANIDDATTKSKDDTLSLLPSNDCLTIEHLDVAVCPINPIVQTTTDPSIANVEYKFSVRGSTGGNIGANILLAGNDRDILLDDHVFSMSWEVIALKEMEKGEKMVVLIDDGSDVGKLISTSRS